MMVQFRTTKTKFFIKKNFLFIVHMYKCCDAYIRIRTLRTVYILKENVYTVH